VRVTTRRDATRPVNQKLYIALIRVLSNWIKPSTRTTRAKHCPRSAGWSSNQGERQNQAGFNPRPSGIVRAGAAGTAVFPIYPNIDRRGSITTISRSSNHEGPYQYHKGRRRMTKHLISLTISVCFILFVLFTIKAACGTPTKPVHHASSGVGVLRHISRRFKYYLCL
jgi:hypothetical protein